MSFPTTSPRSVAEPSAVFVGTACFSVTGAAEPGLLPRLMEIWAKRGLIPERWHAVRGARAGSELAIDIESSGLEPRLADQIAADIRSVIGVTQVLVSEKGSRLGA